MSCRICNSGIHGEKDTDEKKPFSSHPKDRRTKEGRSRHTRSWPFPSFPPPRSRVHFRPWYVVRPRDTVEPWHPVAQLAWTRATCARDIIQPRLRWSSTQPWRQSWWHVTGFYPVRRHRSRTQTNCKRCYKKQNKQLIVADRILNIFPMKANNNLLITHKYYNINFYCIKSCYYNDDTQILLFLVSVESLTFVSYTKNISLLPTILVVVNSRFVILSHSI